MDQVSVVVNDLEAAIAFFVELGMELDGGTTPVEGDWVDRVVGLDEFRVEIAFERTPDGSGRLELTKFHNPTATTAEPNAPANTFGLRRIMFAVDDIDDVVVRLRLTAPNSSPRWRNTRTSIIVALAEQLPLNQTPLHRRHRLAFAGGADDAESTALFGRHRTERAHRDPSRRSRRPHQIGAS